MGFLLWNMVGIWADGVKEGSDPCTVVGKECVCMRVRVCVSRGLLAPCGSDPALPVQIQAPAPADIRVLRGHQLSITCVVITPDDAAIFSAAKDCTIIKCE